MNSCEPQSSKEFWKSSTHGIYSGLAVMTGTMTWLRPMLLQKRSATGMTAAEIFEMTIDTADHVLHRPSGYQSRYAAYARAHHRTSEQMFAHDVLDWPGGRMCGFILWIGQQWRAWRADRNYRAEFIGPDQHADFDAWLNERYPTGQSYHRAMLAERARFEAQAQAERGQRS